MSVKTTGAEFKRFYSDKNIWTDGVWHEEEEIQVNGSPVEPDFDLMTLKDGDQMLIAGGIVYEVDGEPSFEGFFKRWRKQQTTAVFIVEAPLEKVEAVKQAIREAGGNAAA